MSYTFKLDNKYYGENESNGFKTNMYRRVNIILDPGVTVLVGCNGSGKTTFLHQLRNNLEKDDIPYLSYDNLHDGGDNAKSKAGFYGDFDFLASAMISSEGENIDQNIGKFAGKIGNFIYNKITGAEQAFILLDAIDSGLSIDNIIEVKEDMFKFILEDVKKFDLELYFIVSANSYEVARHESCLDIYSGTFKKFKDYEEYRDFILRSREIKNKRYGHVVE